MATLNRINDAYKMNKMINDTKNMDFNKMASNTIDSYANSATNNMNKLASNTIDNFGNSETKTSDNTETDIKPKPNTETNIKPKPNTETKPNTNTSDTSSMSLADKLKKAAAINAASETGTSERSSIGIGDITKYAHNIGKSVGDVSKVFVDTSAEIASIGINATGSMVEVEATATANEANKISGIAADIAKTKLPGIFNNIKDVTKVVAQGIGEVSNVIKNTTIEVKEASKKAQIDTMMTSRPGLTEEQARKELEDAERLEKEKEELQKIQQFELEKAKIAGQCKAERKFMLGGGGRGSTLKNIQKGGKMAAKRTQKSINDFLKPSVTSSSILKLIKGGKRSIKKRRSNYGLRSKRYK